MNVLQQSTAQGMNMIGMPKGLHIKSGETALLRVHPENPNRVLAQFNRFTHPHSHGWHDYPVADWMVKLSIEDRYWAPLVSWIHDEIVMGPFDYSIPEAATADHQDDRVGNQAGYVP